MLEETGSVTRKVGSRIGFLDLVVKSLEVNITASFGVCSVRGCVSRQGSCSNERVPAILAGFCQGYSLHGARPCIRRLAIHSASFTSVFRPGTVFIWRAFTTMAFRSEDSGICFIYVMVVPSMRGVRVLFKSSVFNEFLNEKVCKRRA